MKESLEQFLVQWWAGIAKCVNYDVKVDQLRMAVSCVWMVGHPEVAEPVVDQWVDDWLKNTNPM